MKRFLPLVFTLIQLLFIGACGGNEKDVEVQGLSISQPGAEMEIGETLTLKVAVTPSQAVYDGVSWTSTKPRVASVSSSGLVTALSEGNTTITAMAGGKTASCEITVVKGFVPVSSISLNKQTLELVEGDDYTLLTTILPADASDKTVQWRSSDERIASVIEGVVTAVKAGEASVTARAGDKEASCKVIVSAKVIPVQSIELNETEISMLAGDKKALQAKILPVDATDPSVAWSTSNSRVATVDKGIVSAIDAGTAVIGAKAGDKEAFCIVTVTVAVDGVSLDKTQLSLTLGEKHVLHATVSPTNATNKNVIWSSSDPSVVSVNQSGEITAVKLGSASVTVATEDGNKKATCTVKVDPIPVSGISLNKSSLTLLVGSSESLTATVTPSNATNKDVTWSSSAPDVAAVTSDGLVTAVGVGTSVITATTESGGLKATCTVKVDPIPVSGISLNKGNLTLTPGASEVLVASITPSNATDQTVVWTSSDESVAAVDQVGKVVAKAVGSARIEASCGGKSAFCMVEVSIPVTSVVLDKQSLDMLVDASEKLVCTVLPSNATDQTVTWTSSNPSVASVDAAGTVSALKQGNTTVTASAGSLSASCQVTVSAPYIRLDKNTVRASSGSYSFTITVSANIPYSLTIPPEATWIGYENAGNGKWSFALSENATIIPRRATLKFYSSDHGLSAELTVEQEGKTPEDDTWDGSVAETVAESGSGTQDDPYLIVRCAQIARLAQEVNKGNSYSGKYFKVLANLNFNSLTFTPIGNSSNPFSGNFDGGGKSFTGVKTTGTSCQGFFGSTSGAFINDINLRISTALSSSASRIGGIAGQTANTTIVNCCTFGKVNGWDSVGSLVGYAGTNTSIRNCFSACQNSLGNIYGGSVGGLVGYLCGEMQNCHFYGSINASSFSENTTGGVAGYVHTTATMRNCYFMKSPIGAMNSLSYSGSLNWGSCSNCGSYDTGGNLSSGGKVCDVLNNWVNSHQSSTLTYRRWTGTYPNFVY